MKVYSQWSPTYQRKKVEKIFQLLYSLFLKKLIYKISMIPKNEYASVLIETPNGNFFNFCTDINLLVKQILKGSIERFNPFKFKLWVDSKQIPACHFF